MLCRTSSCRASSRFSSVRNTHVRPVQRAALRVVNKQYVPSDSFGGISPEKKAANALRTLFTFVAAKIILAQLEGSGRGSLGAYNQKSYDELSGFLRSEPLRDGDEWVAKLMTRNSMLALRVLEVRLAYANEDFEFDQLQRLAKKDMSEANTRLMREFAKASFTVAERPETAGVDLVGQAPEASRSPHTASRGDAKEAQAGIESKDTAEQAAGALTISDSAAQGSVSEGDPEPSGAGEAGASGTAG